MSVAGKTIWITGASSGIGEALVYACAAQSANIILSARRTQELERVSAQAGANTYVLPLDLCEPDTFASKTEEAINAFGHIDIIIHNGGISQRGSVMNTELSVYYRMMEVDFFSYVALTKALLPHFQQRRSGHFVVISSVMGKLGTPLRSGYAAAKHALHGFFDCLRAESADNINVTLICPGYVRTNVAVNALSATGEKHGKRDQEVAEGHPADQTAEQILRAVAANRYEAYVGKPFGQERLGLLIKRFLPSLMVRIAERQTPK